ncbi:MAG: hypothetical protein K9M54_07640 [Kiritimatiellales bacterium]|nr:hypothetical protein [Kiritimatiellales bacterium]MCF7864805.1 hypothetical protein [Kiritimatiellales bacterium]
MKKHVITWLLIISAPVFAGELAQLYEKAYFLETAKGQPDAALEIYRQIAASKATDETRGTILKSMERMQVLYRGQSQGSLQEKVNGFNMEAGKINEVLGTFGEPEGYFFGQKELKKNNLPDYYAMTYPDGFSIWMHGDKIEEFRFEDKPLYTIGGITTGIPLGQVMDIMGKPKRTVAGRECTFEENVLYRNSNGWPDGHAYYSAKGLRLFFMHDKLIALYVTDNTILAKK